MWLWNSGHQIGVANLVAKIIPPAMPTKVAAAYNFL